MDLWIDIAPQMVVGRFWKKVSMLKSKGIDCHVYQLACQLLFVLPETELAQVLGNYTSLLDVSSNAANISRGNGWNVSSLAAAGSITLMNQRSYRGLDRVC